MYIVFDITNTKYIPSINDIIYEKKVHNKVLENSFFISFKYIREHYTITNIIYDIPYITHNSILDNNSNKYKHIFFISKETVNILTNIERIILQKYNMMCENKTFLFKLQDKIYKNNDNLMYYDKYNYANPKLYIKFIGVCENNDDNTISIIYKFIIKNNE